MRRISRLIDNEQGVALVLALMILLTLTGLVLAFLSASAFEPQISRNHSETVRARYVAEAGVEYAYDTLATDVGSWNDHLAGATCAQGAVLGAPNSSLPGLGSAHGTFTVRIRNDCKAGDDQLTGVALDTATGGRDPAAPGERSDRAAPAVMRPSVAPRSADASAARRPARCPSNPADGRPPRRPAPLEPLRGNGERWAAPRAGCSTCPRSVWTWSG